MKAVYIFMAFAVTGIGAFLSTNYLHLNNKLSQVLVTDSLYAITGVFLIIAVTLLLANVRKKRLEKGFMTIRQYYQYKSAR
jgi:hypothetical protein